MCLLSSLFVFIQPVSVFLRLPAICLVVFHSKGDFVSTRDHSHWLNSTRNIVFNVILILTKYSKTKTWILCFCLFCFTFIYRCWQRSVTWSLSFWTLGGTNEWQLPKSTSPLTWSLLLNSFCHPHGLDDSTIVLVLQWQSIQYTFVSYIVHKLLLFLKKSGLYELWIKALDKLLLYFMFYLQLCILFPIWDHRNDVSLSSQFCLLSFFSGVISTHLLCRVQTLN